MQHQLQLCISNNLLPLHLSASLLRTGSASVADKKWLVASVYSFAGICHLMRTSVSQHYYYFYSEYKSHEIKANIISILFIVKYFPWALHLRSATSLRCADLPGRTCKNELEWKNSLDDWLGWCDVGMEIESGVNACNVGRKLCKLRMHVRWIIRFSKNSPWLHSHFALTK